MGRRGHQPRRRDDSVNEEFGSEVLVEEKGLVLGLVDDRPFPIEDLRQKLLYRRHSSSSSSSSFFVLRSSENGHGDSL